MALRWVLVRAPKGRFEPPALLSTDVALEAHQIVGSFVRRRTRETACQEAKAHLGV